MKLSTRIDKYEQLLSEDRKNAERTLQALAADGDADAAVVLALAYYDGEFGERDTARCMSLLEQAARLGHPKAIHDLGCFRYHGYGMPPEFQSTKEAVALLSRSADLGYPASQYFLAELILNGEAAAWGKDVAQSLMQAAAAQGHPESIEFLASAAKARH